LKTKCTKPPKVPSPTLCGKAPDGIDCFVCKWYAKNGIEKEDTKDDK